MKLTNFLGLCLIVFISVTLCKTSPVLANQQEKTAVTEPPVQSPVPPPAPPSTMDLKDSNLALFLQYGPVDLLLPSKIGAAIHWDGWEVEYLGSSIKVPWVLKDLGSMSDKRFQIMRRQSLSGWQFAWGVSYNSFQISLGDGLLSRLTGGLYPNVDLVEITTLGAVASFGYRHQWGNWLAGVEIFGWAQPLVTIKSSAPFLDSVSNQDDRDAVQTTIDLIRYFPRWSVAKVSAGYSF
ncbi:MAG: hypothetical protein U1E10_02005 [Bdellovibrionales bacterium]|nr:hypothetical protein [Bdellovibrionales bacterium]